MFFKQPVTPRFNVPLHVGVVLFLQAGQIVGRLTQISEDGCHVKVDLERSQFHPTETVVGERIVLIVEDHIHAFECQIRNFEEDDLGLYFVDSVCRSKRRDLIAKITVEELHWLPEAEPQASCET